MKKAYLSIVFVLCVFFSSAYATNEQLITIDNPGTLLVRSHTTHHSVTGAINCLYLTNMPGLPAGVNSLWMALEPNKATYALLLSAISSGRKIYIRYDLDQPSPWGDNSIRAITAIDLVP